MAFFESFFVDTYVADLTLFFPCHTSSDSSFHNAPSLIPRNTHQPASPFNGRAFCQNINDQSFHEQSETRTRFSPEYIDLPSAMLGAINSGNSCMDEGFELARIQMPPNPFFGMIPACQLLTAFRTSPKHLALMLEPNIHTAFRRLQVNFVHKPGALDAQNLSVKINISHRRSPPGNRLHYAATHGKPGRTI